MEYGGAEIIRGLVKFLRPVINDATEYYFTIVGESGDWRNKIEGRKLQDLNLADQEHLYTKENIEIAETVAEGRIYSYPVIDSGMLGVFKVKNVWNLGSVTGLIYEQEGDGSGHPPYPLQNIVGQEIVLSGFDLNDDLVTTVTQQWDTNSEGIAIGISNTIRLTGTGTFYIKTGSTRVLVTDRLPAIQIKGLVDRIYNAAGYKVKSNFLNNGCVS